MDPIIPFDLKRMFLGDAPPLFLLEIAVRVILIWLWTIVLLRWVGGRSISQMSVVEFLVVIALGSAVGDPMFQPDVPLLHAMLVILLVVLADKAVDIALWRWRHAKRVVDGIPAEVMREGRILVSGAASRKLASSELMELLRLTACEIWAKSSAPSSNPRGNCRSSTSTSRALASALFPPWNCRTQSVLHPARVHVAEAAVRRRTRQQKTARKAAKTTGRARNRVRRLRVEIAPRCAGIAVLSRPGRLMNR